MANKEFDNYLSSVFLAVNKTDPKNYFPEFKANYSGLLPFKKDAAILDVGCGMGHFLQYLKQEGYTNTVGVDISSEAVEYCRAAGLNNVFKIESLGDFLSQNPSKFDFIILKNVIAHLPTEEIVSLLSALRRSLKDNAKLALETFNASNWTGVFARYNDFTHRNAFTENSLRQVLMLAGFKKVKVMPNKYDLSRPGQFIAFLVRIFWQWILRGIYVAERGIGSNPMILSKLLVAVAQER